MKTSELVYLIDWFYFIGSKSEDLAQWEIAIKKRKYKTLISPILC